MYPEGSGSGVGVGVGVGDGVGVGVGVASTAVEVSGGTDVAEGFDVDSDDEQPAIVPIPTIADEVRKSRLFTTSTVCSFHLEIPANCGW